MWNAISALTMLIVIAMPCRAPSRLLDSKISEANFRKLKLGMTQIEVESILGKGKIVEYPHVKPAPTETTLMWHSPERSIVVFLTAPPASRVSNAAFLSDNPKISLTLIQLETEMDKRKK
ncbi:MAG: hypothetical protein HY289_09240 [Planctomycetes bacterium]|nr:hypothetical protein [Planctomycetota bacterium]